MNKKQKRFATTALTYCVVHLGIFTIMQYVSFLITGQEQTALIEQTFLVFGIEAGGLLVKRIVEKIFKVKKEEDDV